MAAEEFINLPSFTVSRSANSELSLGVQNCPGSLAAYSQPLGQGSGCACRLLPAGWWLYPTRPMTSVS